MFNFIWRRFTQWQSRKAPIKRRAERARLAVEMLESRLTPSATASIAAGTTTLTVTTTGDSLTVTNAGFEKFTITDSSGLINTLPAITTTSPVTAMVFNLGSGSNTLTFSGTNALPIDLTGPTTFKSPATYTQTTAGPDLKITGTGGSKTISATDLFLLQSTAGLTMLLTGNGTENTTFTDSNITGSATVTHSGVGDTSFTIATNAANVSALNSWGSLSITNGTGSDYNSITDTDFTGNVTINNGLGDGTTSQYGGSQNLFADGLNKNLLTIGGSLTIGTTSDQSDTEINDYNVHGALSITGGTIGVNGQSNPNFVGVENDPTNPGNGVPTFGSVSITSGGVASAGFEAELGTNSLALPPTQDTPFIVATTLTVSATGTGAVDMILNDLTVGGAATLSTTADNIGANIAVLGDNATSTYGSLTINASATAASQNNVYLQTEPGTLKVLGALGVNFGSEDDVLLVGSAGVPANPPTAATPPGTVTSSGAFDVTGSGGSKEITVVGATFNGMNWALKGAGSGDATGNNSELVTFTDTNVTGTATINNTLTGNTSFTIQTSKNNKDLLNTWGTLSITNGTGSDINNITDTDFTGSVTINNGAGPTGSTAHYGGSHTTFSDDTNGYNTDQLTIAGNLTITTTTGQSDTEVQDYNVHGNVTLGAGAGSAGGNPNVIGLEDNQTVYTPSSGPSTTSGMPMIGGSVTITGTPATNTSLTVAVGTSTTNTGDYPLIIGNGINASITGAGTANVTLNDLTVTGTSNLSVGATGGDTVTVQASSNSVPTTYGPLAISALAGVNGTNTVNLQNVAGVLNVVGALTVSMGAGTDILDVGSATSNVDATGTFTLTGTLAGSNAITVNALEDTFGALNWTLSGQGTETTLFTDTNVIGVATINTSKLTGAAGTTGATATATTSFTINTSLANTAALNTWGGLAITNGAGSDVNLITDTDFTGNVSIANGAGAAGVDTGLDGGSDNIFSDGNNKDLLTIHGTLSITTTTGQSDTEIYDYNVHGNVTLGAGAGYSTQSNPNVIGLEDDQSHAGSGTPVFGGSVTITGGTVTGSPGNPLSPGLYIDLGTNPPGSSPTGTKNYPAIIQGALSITTSGTGAATLGLNDLSVANAATTITLASTNKNDSVQVQGSTTVTSVYDAFTITSAATVANTFSFQDTAGNLEFTGTVKVTLGSGADTLNLAADSSHPSVTNAVIDLFGMSTFNGGAGSNTVYGSPPNPDLFYLDTPTFTDF